MESAIQLQAWRDLYVMLGSSSAALIGLLFVATSLRLNEIANDPVYRVRAHRNSAYLIITLTEAILILTPQPTVILGAGITAINLFGLGLAFSNAYRFLYKTRDDSKRGGMTLYRSITFNTGFMLGIAGGVCLIKQSNWGMYLVTASYATFLVSVTLNAWSIMLGVGRGVQGGES